MLTDALIMYLLAGACSGVLAGLFGIGGGLIVVPLLLVAFHLQGLSEAVITHLAVGTSLATILFTSLSSVRAHLKKIQLDWRLVGQMTLGMALGAFLGGMLAADIPGWLLQRFIGLFALAIAIQMWFNLSPGRDQTSAERPVPAPAELGLVGSLIGVLSALFGIGGGSITVPYLTWRGLRMAKAVATSSATGIPIALFGAASYLLNGWHEANLPPHSLGYVYWPALLGVICTSTFTSRLGVWLAHRLPAPILRRGFALMQLGIAGKFLIFS
ncbi:MAG: sulfite exporter TauE/SafE family protein [Aeromonadaceae bacterium]|nr:sulfite exporter TauE/SafE family protein [Aeromonadaceae bacterium]